MVEVLAADEQVDAIVGIARRRPEWQPPKTTWIQADASVMILSPTSGADAAVHLAWLFQLTHDVAADAVQVNAYIVTLEVTLELLRNAAQRSRTVSRRGGSRSIDGHRLGRWSLRFNRCW